MAGAFSNDEESGLLYSKLSDPSITPSSDSAFRDRVMNGPPILDDQSSLLGRLAGSPAVQGAAMAGPGAPGALLAGLTAQGLGRKAIDTPREPTSFQRDQPPGDLQPMSTPLADVQPAPPLSPNYGRAGTVGGGGFGGAPGGGLKSAWETAQQRQLGALDERKMLEGDAGIAKAGRVQAVGDLEEANALKQQKDAEDLQKQDADTHARFQAYLDKSEKYVDEVRNSKMDPGRLMRNADSGMQFNVAVGSIAGGFLSGMSGGSNHYLDRLDKAIDRDVRAQETDLEAKKFAVGARNNTFSQMLAENGDRRLAGMQTRNLMYEAAKAKLKADSDRLGIPEIRANSLLAINEIEQKQAAMDEDMKKHAFMLAQQAAAAGAAAQRAAEERAWQRQKDVFEMGHKTDELNLRRDEIGTKNAAKPLTEYDKALQERNANIKAIDHGIANIKGITSGTSIDAAASHLPSFLPGVTGSTNRTNVRKDYNIQAMMTVGAAYKLGTDSTEPKRMELLEHYSEPYVIKPTDNEEVAMQKMVALKKLVNENAEAKGPTAPTAPAMPGSFKPK